MVQQCLDFTSSSNCAQHNAKMDERKFDGEQSLSSENVYVSLTYDPLDATAAMARVKSPKAGAVVLFAGLPALLAQTLLGDRRSGTG